MDGVLDDILEALTLPRSYVAVMFRVVARYRRYVGAARVDSELARFRLGRVSLYQETLRRSAIALG